MCPDRGSYMPTHGDPVPMTPLGSRLASVRNSVNGPTRRRRRSDFRPSAAAASVVNILLLLCFVRALVAIVIIL